MIINPIGAPKVVASQKKLLEFLDENINGLSNGSILAIASNVISLCEGRLVAKDQADKYQLVRNEAELYYPAASNRYRHHFTITRNTILGASGIDESNGGGYYVLLPDDVQGTANKVRQHLKNRFDLKELGIVITDSTSIPLRLG